MEQSIKAGDKSYKKKIFGAIADFQRSKNRKKKVKKISSKGQILWLL